MKFSREKQSQSAFFDSTLQISKEFGGSLHGRGNAKRARPLSTKHPMHLVLRSSVAKGAWSMRSPKNIRMIEQTVQKIAKQYGIKIYQFANVGNHLHLLIKLTNRFTFAPFIRAVTGMIAMKVTGAKKLSGMKFVLASKLNISFNAKSSSNSDASTSDGQTAEAADDVAKSSTASTPKFWDFRPWSRIVEWGKAYAHAKAYVFQNEQEAAGKVPYKPRTKWNQPTRAPS